MLCTYVARSNRRGSKRPHPDLCLDLIFIQHLVALHAGIHRASMSSSLEAACPSPRTPAERCTSAPLLLALPT
jgi:hypothetical protein